jgi:hypothetical protein
LVCQPENQVAFVYLRNRRYSREKRILSFPAFDLAVLRNYFFVGILKALLFPIVVFVNSPYVLYAGVVCNFAVQKLRHVHLGIKDFGKTADWLRQQTL